MASSDHDFFFLAEGSSCPATACRQSPRFANWNHESPDSARRKPDIQGVSSRKPDCLIDSAVKPEHPT